MAAMIAPTRDEHQNVAPFESAFEECYCLTCIALDTPLDWQPPEGLPWQDWLSERPDLVEVWYATCPTCSVEYRLQWIMQRPSDHSTAYGQVRRIDDGDEDGSAEG